MDFVIGFPQSFKSINSIWVIVDRPTKSAYFLLVQSTFSVEWLARVYIQKVVHFYGGPMSIISNRGSQFTSSFWKDFLRELGIQVDLSTAFHPQTDSQLKHNIQVPEDMLGACVLEFDGLWDQYFPQKSLRTTTTSTQVFRWLRLGPYMVGIVALLLNSLSP